MAWLTRPTRPAPVTAGIPTAIPSSVPLSISIAWLKLERGPDTTRAVAVSTLPAHGRSSEADSSASCCSASEVCTLSASAASA